MCVCVRVCRFYFFFLYPRVSACGCNGAWPFSRVMARGGAACLRLRLLSSCVYISSASIPLWHVAADPPAWKPAADNRAASCGLPHSFRLSLYAPALLQCAHTSRHEQRLTRVASLALAQASQPRTVRGLLRVRACKCAVRPVAVTRQACVVGQCCRRARGCGLPQRAGATGPVAFGAAHELEDDGGASTLARA